MNHKIRSILTNIEGVLRYELHAASFTMAVTFDDTKVSVEEIVERISKGGYPVSGGPQWVK